MTRVNNDPPPFSGKQNVDADAYSDLLVQTGNLVRWLKEIGCSGFDCNPAIVAVPGKHNREKKYPSETVTDIRRRLGECQRCVLAETRKTIVFGEGNTQARLVFVGEGPGHEENQQGRPFVGAAGILLDKIINAMGMSRQDVYIANIIKCRPPGNRNPESDEIESCLPFLVQQLKAIQPEFICALGATAAQALLQTKLPISSLRGKFHPWQADIRLMPTFHPAYLLRNPGKKKDTWDDIKKLMHAMRLPLSV
jgi:uracil-DNA glycosylase family 4